MAFQLSTRKCYRWMDRLEACRVLSGDDMGSPSITQTFNRLMSHGFAGVWCLEVEGSRYTGNIYDDELGRADEERYVHMNNRIRRQPGKVYKMYYCFEEFVIE